MNRIRGIALSGTFAFLLLAPGAVIKTGLNEGKRSAKIDRHGVRLGGGELAGEADLFRDGFVEPGRLGIVKFSRFIGRCAEVETPIEVQGIALAGRLRGRGLLGETGGAEAAAAEEEKEKRKGGALHYESKSGMLQINCREPLQLEADYSLARGLRRTKYLDKRCHLWTALNFPPCAFHDRSHRHLFHQQAKPTPRSGFPFFSNVVDAEFCPAPGTGSGRDGLAG